MNKLTIPALSLAALMASGIAFAQTQPETKKPAEVQKQDSTVVPTQPDKSKTTATTPAMTKTVSIDAASDILASKFIGMTVYSADNKNIGDVNDLLFDKDGKVKAVIIGIGGFLGMGEKDVALPLSQINMTRDENGKVKLTVTASGEELNAAPTFDPSKFNPSAPANNTTTTTPATPSKTTTGG